MGNKSSSLDVTPLKPITYKDFIEKQEQIKQDMIASDLQCMNDNSNLIFKKINSLIERESLQQIRGSSDRIDYFYLKIEVARIEKQQIVDKIVSILKSFENVGWFFRLFNGTFNITQNVVTIRNKHYPTLYIYKFSIHIYSIAQTSELSDGILYTTEPTLYTQENCVICLNSPNPNYFFSPCGHQCICKKCTKKYKDKGCPVCRTPYVSINQK